MNNDESKNTEEFENLDDEKDFEEINDDELSDDNSDVEEYESEGEVPSSDYSDYREVQNNELKKQVRDKLRNKVDKNLQEKLRNREGKQLAHDIQKKSAEETAKKEAEKKAIETAGKTKAAGTVGKTAAAGTATTGTAAAGTAAAGTAAGTGATTGLAALAANPYFWIVVAILAFAIILIILIVILYVAYSGNDEESDNASGGQVVCTYNLNGIDISNLKVRLLDCDTNQPIPGEELVDFNKYVLGVAYAENDAAPDEGFKAEALAAKSYALRRPDQMGNAFGLKIEEQNGQHILNIRNCTSDQVYCDPDKGCSTETGDTGNTVYSGATTKAHQYKPALSADHHLRVAAADIDDKILTDSTGNVFYATYTDVNQNEWNALANQGKTYKEMLESTYSGAKVTTISCKHVAGSSGGSCVTSTPLKLASGQTAFTISSPFGYRNAPTAGASSYHQGIDLPAELGTPIYSVFEGIVSIAGFDDSAGNMVIIDHDLDGDGKTDYTTQYFHMTKYIVKTGDKVSGGQQIGEVGSTGASTGAHLHFGIKDSTGKLFDPDSVLTGLINKTSVFDQAKICKNKQTGSQNTNFNANNDGSSSGGTANTCNANYTTTTQPDPAIAMNYWHDKGVINKNDFIYPKEEATGYSLGAHPKNFKYQNLTNMKNYNGIFAWPVTPTNDEYTYVYDHTGIDIMAPFGTPVYAPVSGQLDYSEWGHTVNKNCNETAYSVKIKLDTPFVFEGTSINYIFLTHMIGLTSYCPQSTCNRRINQGELVGFVGWANATHLHITFCSDESCNSGLSTPQIERVYSISPNTKRKAGE